jgi:hypothetical protein
VGASPEGCAWPTGLAAVILEMTSDRYVPLIAACWQNVASRRQTLPRKLVFFGDLKIWFGTDAHDSLGRVPVAGGGAPAHETTQKAPAIAPD